MTPDFPVCGRRLASHLNTLRRRDTRLSWTDEVSVKPVEGSGDARKACWEVLRVDGRLPGIFLGWYSSNIVLSDPTGVC